MVTNVQSTELDFDQIRTSLKTFFKASPEFTDYDFEGSGLANILDVLAYNTHYNALINNISLNEAFLETAQLRGSVVSHAASLGYFLTSKNSARSKISISLDLSSESVRPVSLSILKGELFVATVDDISFTFQTAESSSASDDGYGFYQFKNVAGTDEIPLQEGVSITKTFYVENSAESQVYVIQDKDIDMGTADVQVFSSPTSVIFDSYSNISTAVEIESSSKHYILKEAPNGNFELVFGAGISMGLRPEAGNMIKINYLRSSGLAGNNAKLFSMTNTITVNDNEYTASVLTVSNSSGGADKKSVENIRQIAPLNYSAHKRIVTAQDYKSQILAQYSEFITDVTAWGGEDNDPVDFGSAYISLVFPENTSEGTKDSVKTDIKSNLLTPLSVLSITPKYVDPIDTYLVLSTSFYFNPNLASVTAQLMQNNITALIVNYFDENLGTFNKTFRKSILLNIIDDFSSANLSSDLTVKMQQRFTPTLNSSASYKLMFPTTLAISDDVNYIIESSQFIFESNACRIKNKLGSNKIQIVDNAGNVIVDNAGSFNAAAGEVSIVGFKTSSILGSENFIKVSAVPANQSLISPLRNYILRYDKDLSEVITVVDYENRRTTI
jgi:hypothetical protein